MGAPEIEAFLSHLAQEGNLSASTQNQAFNAILFLYRNGLKIEPTTPVYALRAKRSQHLPTVLSKNEVNLLYGCGLRVMECLRLRVKDIDFEQCQIVVREGKGEAVYLSL